MVTGETEKRKMLFNIGVTVKLNDTAIPHCVTKQQSKTGIMKYNTFRATTINRSVVNY